MNCNCSSGPQYKPVTHVIFDLDGTIIDSESVYAVALKSTVEYYGGKYFPEFQDKVKGSPSASVAKTSIQTFNLNATVKDFLEKYEGYADKSLSNLDLMPGAEKIILHLHNNNIPIAVATSSSQPSYDLKTHKYANMFSKFHHIICGGSNPEVKNGKPAPDIFLLAASRFNNPPDPSKCLVFEDSENGLRAGLAAGMQVVMLPEASVPQDVWKLATLKLDSFNHLKPELFGLPPFPANSGNKPCVATCKGRN